MTNDLRSRDFPAKTNSGTLCALLCVLTACAATCPAATYYVNAGSSNPVPPYADWNTAATTIQDAVDLTMAGDLVLVTNGTYGFGGRPANGSLTNRVAITNAITVRSVNGPATTSILGTNGAGPGNARCAYLASGSLLADFTLISGGTLKPSPPDNLTGPDFEGAGAFCADTTAAISNCVLTGCVAANVGGGAFGGTFLNCLFTNNTAGGAGGAAYGSLSNCTLVGNTATGWANLGGGGAAHCTLNNCSIVGNLGSPTGSGASSCTLNNCLVVTNGSDNSFGGAATAACTLNNCTVVGNKSGFQSAAAVSNTINNCILYYNIGGPNYSGGVLNSCCTTPLPANGIGNFTNAPLFVSSQNLRLHSGSPCINAGKNSYAPGSVDLDGNQRVSGGTVDSGAYEYQNPPSIISYAWLQQYRLATDGSADYSDPDNDGMNNWQEWVCGTNPTNAQSVLRMLPPINNASSVTVAWQSVSNRSYSVERATNIGPSQLFGRVASGVTGLPALTSFTDTNPPTPGPLFYRVRVEQ